MQFNLNSDDDLDIDAATRMVEEKLIRAAWTRSRGNKSKAAQLLNCSRQGLYKRLRRLHLNWGTYPDHGIGNAQPSTG